LTELRRSSRHEALTETMASAARPQDQELESVSTIRTVLHALRQLPEIDRAALLLRTQERMPYEEIAQILNLSTVNAKVKVHRARLKLATLIPRTVLP
jgi:RNA polymerase sigma-70 factor (ECF subfamily)